MIWHDARTMGGEGVLGGVSVSWGSATDVGLRRAVNEDAVLADPPVFVVADGMGGHDAGDVASRLVIDEFVGLLGSGMRALDDITGAIRSVNTTIYDAGQASDHLRSMGTTAVGLMLVDNGDRPSWLLFNVGDSRAYRFAENTLEQLSTDHSYVQELVDAGDITDVAARTHPQRNVVTRALGVDEAVQPDFWLRAPTPGERFVLCSDGLSSEVDDVDIAEVLGARRDPGEAAAELVARALAAGGRDNVTVLVLDVVAVDELQEFTGDTAPRDLPVPADVARSADAPSLPTPEIAPGSVSIDAPPAGDPDESPAGIAQVGDRPSIAEVPGATATREASVAERSVAATTGLIEVGEHAAVRSSGGDEQDGTTEIDSTALIDAVPRTGSERDADD